MLCLYSHAEICSGLIHVRTLLAKILRTYHEYVDTLGLSRPLQNQYAAAAQEYFAGQENRSAEDLTNCYRQRKDKVRQVS